MWVLNGTGSQLARSQNELPSFRHSVERIADQIDQYLPQLSLRGEDCNFAVAAVQPGDVLHRVDTRKWRPWVGVGPEPTRVMARRMIAQSAGIPQTT
jgi:hypothetical protein